MGKTITNEIICQCCVDEHVRCTCSYLMAMGRSRLVALLLLDSIMCASAASSGGSLKPTLGCGLRRYLKQYRVQYSAVQ